MCIGIEQLLFSIHSGFQSIIKENEDTLLYE